MIALALKLSLANAPVPFQCTRTRARPFCIIHIYAHAYHVLGTLAPVAAQALRLAAYQALA